MTYEASGTWREVYGKVFDVKEIRMSADAMYVKRRDAQYTYGWYLYLSYSRGEWGSNPVPPTDPDRLMGYLDAANHYEGT